MDTWLNRKALPDEILGVADDETLWARVREVRDRLLVESDWTQLPDVPLDERDTWAAYRQELRDITNCDDPRDVVLPKKPGDS